MEQFNRGNSVRDGLDDHEDKYLKHSAVKMNMGLFRQVPENECQKTTNLAEIFHTEFLPVLFLLGLDFSGIHSQEPSRKVTAF